MTFDVASTLIPLAPFIMIIFIVWFGSLTHRARERHRAELQKDLLTKFSTAQELADFMKTDGGKLLMPAPLRVRTPAHLAGVGVIVVVVGGGLFAASWMSSEVEAVEGLRIAALIAIAAGVGLLASAFVTQKLTQKWKQEDVQPQ